VRVRAAALVLLLAACASGGHRFTARLPHGLPDISRWEKSAGSAEFKAPDRSLEYELYVAPQRPSVYSVTRYRVREAGAVPANEKLQWDRDGRDVRRYECVADAGDAACRWREFSHGSKEYDGELSTLVAVYFLHAELLHRRAGAPVR